MRKRIPLVPHWIRILTLVLSLAAWPDRQVYAGASSSANATPDHDVPQAFAIDTWETDDGLPRNVVIALTQTRDGYLWLGTLNGLVRFDGVRFEVFNESNTPGLASGFIVSLFEDSRSRLWVGTETAGAFRVSDGAVSMLDLGKGSRESRVRSVCEDGDGNVWLYTADGQLARCRDGEVQIWPFATDRSSVTRCVVAAEESGVWVGVDWEASRVTPPLEGGDDRLVTSESVPVNRLDFLLSSRSGGHWRLGEHRIERWRDGASVEHLGNYPWTSPVLRVSTACEDNEGRVIIGTLGAGLFWLRPGGGAVQFSTEGIRWLDGDGRVTRLSTEEQLSNNYVLAIAVDREGSLWAGTDAGGLNRIRSLPFLTVPETRRRVVQAIARDENGGVWIGYNGGGLDYRAESGTTRFGPAQGLPNRAIRALLVDESAQVWVGTLGAGIYNWDGQRFRRFNSPLSIIHCLLEDAEGNLWAGGERGLARYQAGAWTTYASEDGLPSATIRCLAQDVMGAIWIGADGAGLARLVDGEFSIIRAEAGGLPGDGITCLLPTPEGGLWVGTSRSGMAYLYKDRWTVFGAARGLVSNEIGYIQRDADDNLWIGSPAGLMRIESRVLDSETLEGGGQLAGRVFNRADGLPTRDYTIGPGLDLNHPGQMLWFPTIKGLAGANPQQLKPNALPPPVTIVAVTIEGEEQGKTGPRTPLPDEIVVPPRREQIEIRYTSLNLAAPERATFRYRLHGHETRWTEAGNSRVVRYSRLPPGSYQFEVTAENEDGVENPAPATLSIIVLPPFWRTWWFLGLTSLSLMAAVTGGVHFVSTQRLQAQLARMRQQEALERERARIARDLHDQLGANLTQVSLLGELAESDKEFPEEVESHARQISQTARETTRALDEIVWTVNPSNDTLEGLTTYLCKYAQEYFSVAGLRYRQEVPDTLPETSIPPELRHNIFLAAKEAITNVVKHARASEARLRLIVKEDAWMLEIEDNGRGPAGMDRPEARSRNGLRNMRRRLEESCGRFELRPAESGGTLVRLTVPL